MAKVTRMNDNRIPIGIAASNSPKYKIRQTACQNTWVKELDSSKYLPVFLVSSRERVGNEDYVYSPEEQTLYTNSEDSRDWLTTKTKLFMRWFLNDTSATHFWRCDDDSYINPLEFNKYDTFLNYDYCGSKLYLKGGDWPEFMSGAGYSVSRKATELIEPHILPNGDGSADDLRIGQNIRSRFPDALWYNEDNIHPFTGCKKIDGLLIGHPVSPEDMETMHNYYKEGN